jgi:hypothetical protein
LVFGKAFDDIVVNYIQGNLSVKNKFGETDIDNVKWNIKMNNKLGLVKSKI